MVAVTHYEASCLVGAGKEAGWMSHHLVLQPHGGTVFRLSSQSLPKIIWTRRKKIVTNLFMISQVY